MLIWGCPNLHLVYEAHHSSPSSSSLFFYDMISRNWNTAMPAHCNGVFITTKFGYGFHVPYWPNRMKGATVTLLRKPSDRLISAFLFNDGMMLPRGSPWKKASRAVKDVINSTLIPIGTYSLLPGVDGCQTKMILGKQCGDVYTLTKSDITSAIEIVSSPEHFAFIGLTEEAEATALLFLAMYGPCYDRAGELVSDTLVQQAHLKTLHKTYSHRYRSNKRNSLATHAKLHMQLHAVGWRDEADDAVYNAARRTFYKRCDDYNISY